VRSLDKKFEKAFEVASKMTQKLPPDVMLELYAYYKLATKGKKYMSPSGDDSLRNAFKLNAVFQLKELSEDDSKKKYIKLIEKITKNKL
jgi:acyl-CoA-binding protein